MRQLRELTLVVCLFCVAETAAVQAAPQGISDTELTTKVKTALSGERAVKARDIEVQTREGVVQLSGFVDSEAAQTAAVMRARSVDGVQEVRNDLSIRTDRPAQEPVSDTVIAARVRDSLGNVRLAGDSDVNVEVSKGVVQLSGFVKSVEEKTRAADAASAVAGVRDVENHIALLDEGAPSPRK
ncbi:MAG: BON domain-containing protein [Pseudomonadota bacterium]|nr:BON domain-containing protein [Pseudomonadota bacterium]